MRELVIGIGPSKSVHPVALRSAIVGAIEKADALLARQRKKPIGGTSDTVVLQLPAVLGPRQPDASQTSTSSSSAADLIRMRH